MDQDRYDKHFHQLKHDLGLLSSFDYKGFDLDYFWLTSEQLRRSVDEGFWKDENINGAGLKALGIEKSEDHLSLYDQVGAHNLIGETRSMYYLYKRNNSSSEIEGGAFHLGHY